MEDRLADLVVLVISELARLAQWFHARNLLSAEYTVAIKPKSIDADMRLQTAIDREIENMSTRFTRGEGSESKRDFTIFVMPVRIEQAK